MHFVRIIAFGALLLPSDSVLAQQANLLLADVMAQYQGAMQASFTHTMTSPVWDGQHVTHGQIILQDDRYRIETEYELIIGHGADIWIWRPEDNQLLISSTDDEGLAFAPGALFRDYSRHYAARDIAVTQERGVPHYQLTLTPVSDNFPVREIVLWVRQPERLITRIRVVDYNDTQMEFRLSDIVPAADIAPGTFEFRPPDGAEIIDLRS